MRLVERLARADVPPGGEADTCEETYRKRKPRERLSTVARRGSALERRASSGLAT